MEAKKHDRPRAALSDRGVRVEPQMGHLNGGADSTLPPTPLKDLLSAGGANLFVLTADAQLVETVQAASGEQYPVFAVNQWSELEQAVASGRCGIALLDAALLQGDVLKRIAALEPYSNRLVTLVAAERSNAEQFMGLLSERRIHRLLIKPAALGITKLLVESAVNRCLQLRDSGVEAFGAADLVVKELQPKRGSHFRVVFASVAALVIGVAVVSVVAGWWRNAPSPEPTVSNAAHAPSTNAPEPERSRFASLLEHAEHALSDGRLATPTGDNALDDYLTVLSTEPTNETARQGLASVVDLLFTQAEAAILANQPEVAADVLAAVRRGDPGSGRLAFLNAQLERAQASAAVQRAAAAPAPPPARAPASPPAAEPTELESLLRIAAARVQRGQLLEPRGDSAQEYLDRAAQLDPNDRRIGPIRSALAAALLAEGRGLLEQGKLDGAAERATVARGLGATADELAAFETKLGAARSSIADEQRARWLRLARERLQSGALLEPQDDSALTYLRRLQSESPEFPGLDLAWTSFTQAAGARAQTRLAAKDWAGAEALLKGLATAPGSATTAGALAKELEAGRLQERFLATASPAGELELLSYTRPVYPLEASQRGIEGFVELEFVVDTEGRPTNLAVVKAEPQGRFDRAALTAVGQYRYAPYVRDGRTYQRRVHLRISFVLQ